MAVSPEGDLSGRGEPSGPKELSGHGGELAFAALRAHGVSTMFTLSGGHVFPLYDAAVHADPPMRIVDVRHEQSAVFAAEAVAKLTRRPGLAVLTAGPGITNGMSAVTTAAFNGSPVLVLGGRAPHGAWGQGSLQELDHVPLLAPVTKSAATAASTAAIAPTIDAALRTATAPHRGPVFVDIPVDEIYGAASVPAPAPPGAAPVQPDPEDVARVAAALAAAERPVLVLGGDVWTDGAEAAAVRFVETLGIPAIANGMGRGILPPGHPQLVTRARGPAFGGADLVVVAGTPLDFRLGFGAFGGRGGNAPAAVVHLADSPGQVATHAKLAASAAGDLTAVFDGVAAAAAPTTSSSARPRWRPWLAKLRAAAELALAADAELLGSDADPVHPARVYGELLRRLDSDAVVIGDGGDFVSFAGRFVEPGQPGCWLDPGPFGCLGTGLGYAMGARIARPAAQVALLLGDGAAGFSLMDVDTLVRHRLPVVMIVGNNGIWGLEKNLMQPLYGWDVAADLQPQCRYDEVVRALGGAGELVTRPGEIGAALDRAFASGVPYLVNVATDPEVFYPRSTIL